MSKHFPGGLNSSLSLILNQQTGTSYTLQPNDSLVEFSNVTGVTVTLPESTTLSNGKQYFIIKTGSGSAVTINISGSDTIDDKTSIVLNNQWQRVLLTSNTAGRWYT